MKRDLSELNRRRFDLLIIGGGIVGAGIARDAAMRGLSVALVDQGDFASGTSSKSSKLIHGGFRYLEQYDLRLVAESCRERRVLQRIAPRRVSPIPFLLPVYADDPRPLWKMRLGMTLYDLLALYRNTAPHRTLGPEAALAAEPALNPIGLRGAIRYYDCQEDDARFCLDNVLHAARLGASCANYCQINGLAFEGDRVIAARGVDQIDGRILDIRASTFINATGPWLDDVQRIESGEDRAKMLAPTKGVHLLIPRVAATHAICFQAKRDGRIMFVLPWNDCSLVGTTDTDFAGDPNSARAEPPDVKYLLDELAHLFPNSGVGPAQVFTTFAGVRALLASDASNPSARSREHGIIRRGPNLLHIAGGKYTTYRLIAAQAVNGVYQMLGRPAPRCRTGETALNASADEAPAGRKLSDSPQVYESDVIRACREEMAASVADVMYRRTGLALSRHGDGAVAESVATLMARTLGWSDARRAMSLADYLAQRSAAKAGL